MKKLLLAGASICALTAMTHLARAGDLQAYRKPVCETAEDYAGCMANKKPQMWATDGIKWDCRHGFSLTDESGDMGLFEPPLVRRNLPLFLLRSEQHRASDFLGST